MDVRGFLNSLIDAPDYEGQIVHVQAIEPREAAYAACETDIPEGIQSLLRRRNIHKLYTHQAAAVDAIAGGDDVVIETATASGKTLCYNLTVAQALLADPDARAMYIFPTKALAQDQLGTLRGWTDCDDLGAGAGLPQRHLSARRAKLPGEATGR